MGDRDDTQAGRASTFSALLGALAHAPELPLEPPTPPPPPPIDLAPGRCIGRYRIAAQLGRGGMGAVYRARDQVLDRDVALKVLFVGAAASPVDRFRREVVALARVAHENVVAVHDAGVDGALPYVVLELVEGQTLRERLGAGALPTGEVIQLARDVARGLAAAHAVGVVHRDLKPENILVDARGTAKLVDFGLARLVERDDRAELGLTDAGTLLGTAHYMAPEQVRGEPGDHRIDCFAFGAVLFEMLAGRRAFEARSRAEVITAVLRDQPVSDPALLADPRTRRLLGIAFRCLDKAPERRLQSADEILAALDLEAAPAIDVPPSGDIPETRYARSSGVHIAYQVVSPPGPPTLVAAAPFISNIDVMWEDPRVRDWLAACGSFTHLVHYDRRGVGMSDPIAPECTIEERADDLRAVLDAEGIERAFLLGFSEGGPSAIAFAARHPERVRGLILMGSFARLVRGDGYDRGMPRAAYDALAEKWVAHWATPKTLSVPIFVASQAKDPAFRRWGSRYERQCASPGTVKRLLDQQWAIDVRHYLPQVRCPTLVVHRRGDAAIHVEHGRYLGEQIAGARYVELDGIDHVPWYGDPAPVLALMRELVGGISSPPPAR